MRKILLLMIACLSLIGCDNSQEKVDKSKLTGYDYRLFQDTPAWLLAKAVEEGNISKIKTEVLENKVNPNYQEPKYGNTLLMLAIANNEYNSAKALLSVGADPNLPDKHRGGTAMIHAAENDNPKYLKLLLLNKGNPDAAETIVVENDDSPLQTATTSAISFSRPNSLEKVKILVEAGANVNFPDSTIANNDLPLGKAFLQDRIDIVLYLLKKGADYKRVMYKMIDGRDIYILEALRKSIIDMQSPGYQNKLEVIAFLKSKGLDYYKEPIPDYILKEIKKKYPKDWVEYARKY